MKTPFRTLAATALLSMSLGLFPATSAQAADAQTCQPGIVPAFQGPHVAQYTAIANALIPQFNAMSTQLKAMVDQATYAPLLASAQAVAGSIANGRILIALPDGTVVLDTSRNNNTYANFVAKAINENHNSRVAILAAQEYACGFGVESKFSTSTGQNESYLAIRSGAFLDSAGTIRISSRQ